MHSLLRLSACASVALCHMMLQDLVLSRWRMRIQMHFSSIGAVPVWTLAQQQQAGHSTERH